MPFIALKKLLLHRHMTGRDYAALILLVVVVGSFVSNYIQYQHSQDALRVALDSRTHLRHDRKVTDRGLCRAVNQSRQINNRDRLTFLRAEKETRRDLKIINDPLLLGLLRRSLVENRRELHSRPYLPPINCRKLIENPTRSTVPPITTTTSG